MAGKEYTLPFDSSFYDDIDKAMATLEAWHGSFKTHPRRDEILDGFRYLFIMVKLGATPTSALGNWSKFAAEPETPLIGLVAPAKKPK